MKKILLTAVALLALMSCKDDIVCETVVIDTRDYHDNGAYQDSLGYYDIITHEFEDCY